MKCVTVYLTPNSFICAMICTIFLFFTSGCREEEQEEEPTVIKSGAWTDLQKGVSIAGWGDAYCISVGSKGYVIVDQGAFFEIDFDDDFSRKRYEFPVNGGTAANFTLVHSNNSVLAFTEMGNMIYKFQQDEWSNHDTLPFYYGYFDGYYHGMVTSDYLYLLSSHQSFRYSKSFAVWDSLSAIPIERMILPNEPPVAYTGYSITGVNHNGKVYLFQSKGYIFEYDPENDKWNYITKYPGHILDRVISFSWGNKLYFGLSHIDHSPSYKEYWFDNKLWSFNIESKQWKEEQSFPFKLSHGRFVSFFINGLLYVGHEPLKNYYLLYTFDPSEAK